MMGKPGGGQDDLCWTRTDRGEHPVHPFAVNGKLFFMFTSPP
jgi:hypothetical protein